MIPESAWKDLQRIADEATSYIRKASPYPARRRRYAEVCLELYDPTPGTHPLSNHDTLLDVGAGWTHLDYYLRREWDWMGRYFPVDLGMTGYNLDAPLGVRPFKVLRPAWVVAAEILEHLERAGKTIQEMKYIASKGVIVTVPNPESVDVLAQCPDHKTVIERDTLENAGFAVREILGGRCLIGVWRRGPRPGVLESLESARLGGQYGGS